MFFYLSQYLLNAAEGTQWADPLSGLRIFKYVMFRSAGAAMTRVAAELVVGAENHRVAQSGSSSARNTRTKPKKAERSSLAC
jgi:hypothetical protein